MTPIMWAAVAAVIFVVAALVIRNMQSKEPGTNTAMTPVAQLFASAEPLRMRSQFDVETDEDLIVINEVYREQRRGERARQALERLAPLVPSAKSK